MNAGMLVLGIDPGTAITGYGIVQSDGQLLASVSYGVVTTSSDRPLYQRLQRLYGDMQALISSHRPTHVAVEELFFSRNVRTALSVGHARGVILLAAAQAGLPLHSYSPLEVKNAVTGYGRATKEQMQQMVRLLLNLDSTPQPDDAADALAVAICHAHSYSTRARLAEHDARLGQLK